MFGISFLSQTFLLLASQQPQRSSPGDSASVTVIPTTCLEVCLSPGCVADGAQETLEKLKALAPPDRIRIVPGGCVSGCGKGPIVRELQDKEGPGKKKNVNVIHRRVGAVNGCETLLTSLLNDSGDSEDKDGDDLTNTIPPKLIEGYDSVVQAHDTMKKKDFVAAASLYSKGIQLAGPIATKNNYFPCEDREEKSTSITPVHLEWLVKAYCSQAEAYLQTKDLENAYESACEACSLSQNSDFLCLDTLSVVCQAKKDSEGEFKALQTYFALDTDVEEHLLPRDVANRRRELGFRLAKLEREIQK